MGLRKLDTSPGNSIGASKPARVKAARPAASASGKVTKSRATAEALVKDSRPNTNELEKNIGLALNAMSQVQANLSLIESRIDESIIDNEDLKQARSSQAQEAHKSIEIFRDSLIEVKKLIKDDDESAQYQTFLKDIASDSKGLIRRLKTLLRILINTSFFNKPSQKDDFRALATEFNSAAERTKDLFNSTADKYELDKDEIKKIEAGEEVSEVEEDNYQSGSTWWPNPADAKAAKRAKKSNGGSQSNTMSDWDKDMAAYKPNDDLLTRARAAGEKSATINSTESTKDDSRIPGTSTNISLSFASSIFNASSLEEIPRKRKLNGEAQLESNYKNLVEFFKYLFVTLNVYENVKSPKKHLEQNGYSFEDFKEAIRTIAPQYKVRFDTDAKIKHLFIFALFNWQRVIERRLEMPGNYEALSVEDIDNYINGFKEGNFGLNTDPEDFENCPDRTPMLLSKASFEIQDMRAFNTLAYLASGIEMGLLKFDTKTNKVIAA